MTERINDQHSWIYVHQQKNSLCIHRLDPLGKYSLHSLGVTPPDYRQFDTSLRHKGRSFSFNKRHFVKKSVTFRKRITSQKALVYISELPTVFSEKEIWRIGVFFLRSEALGKSHIFEAERSGPFREVTHRSDAISVDLNERFFSKLKKQLLR